MSESPKKDMTASVSESENPAIPAPTAKHTRPSTNRDWWPNQLDVSVLHKHSTLSNPLGTDFKYAEEFKKLDVEALKRRFYQEQTIDTSKETLEWLQKRMPPGIGS